MSPILKNNFRKSVAKCLPSGQTTVLSLHLAARRDAKPQLVDRLLAYIQHSIDAAGDDRDAAAAWHMMKYRMLIALDRPKTLEASLRGWIMSGLV